MALIDDNKRFNLWAIAVSLLVFVLIAIDLFGDYRNGVSWTHLLTEVVILMLSLAGLVYFGRLSYQLAQSKISGLTQDLALAEQQARQWRETNRELVAGLAAQIQKQFDLWHLTPAEAEVGLLILKGLGLNDIAELRRTSERTIRDQAQAVYRKAGVAGRSELSAFFLEDLLPPR
ncbi:helix-turn-helix transcriptional regulator [Methylomonas sp. MED-D]|uniref:helix-turn-helix transcriptional regulator n=1 Tax=Methylomonas sp. MED-D TaxID=3418768 RepID=UPI003D079458